MQDEEPPIVRCLGCHHPTEAKERTLVTDSANAESSEQFRSLSLPIWLPAHKIAF
jgi:hypothetical protein